MKKDRMKQAWAALALALAMLVGLEIAWKHVPLLSANFKNSSFLGGKPKPEAPEEKGEVMLPGLEKAPLTPVPSHTTPAQVRRLFAEMEAGKRKRLRIAYFADSIGEGDLITDVMRKDLQAAYGGKGVGFQGIAPRDWAYRAAVLHRPGKGWQRLDLGDLRKHPGLALGINGEAYRVEAGLASAGLRLEKPLKTPDPWYGRATLYYGPGPARIELKGKGYELKGKGLFNSFRIPGPPQAKLEPVFSGPGALFYGISLDSPEGIQVDNFSFRGNGGDGLAALSPEMLKAGQAALHYDLVMLHFGINALKQGEKEYHWYRALLRKSLAYFQKNLPGARIVVVSVMDHGVKEGREIASDSSLPYVLAAQEAAAADCGVWFIDLYKLTGGAGVMRAWAEAKEPLANKDYTHPNRRGGARIAKLLLSELLGTPPPPPPAGSTPPEAAHAP